MYLVATATKSFLQIVWFTYSPATSRWIKNFNVMGLGCAIFVSECRINYTLNANQTTLWIWVLLLHHKQKPTKRQLCVGTNSCMVSTSNWKARCFCFCFLCTWKRIFITWSKPMLKNVFWRHMTVCEGMWMHTCEGIHVKAFESKNKTYILTKAHIQEPK